MFHCYVSLSHQGVIIQHIPTHVADSLKPRASGLSFCSVSSRNKEVKSRGIRTLNRWMPGYAAPSAAHSDAADAIISADLKAALHIIYSVYSYNSSMLTHTLDPAHSYVVAIIMTYLGVQRMRCAPAAA